MVILVKRFGQLGNRLFLFAHLVANAAEHGYAVANPSFAAYARFFEAPAADDFGALPVRLALLPQRWLARALERLLGLVQRPQVFRGLAAVRRWLPAWAGLPQLLYLDDSAGTFDLNTAPYLAAVRQRVVLLHGWCFRDRPSFARHAGLIRRLFALVPPHREAVQAVLARCRRTAEVLVGVHIRRGDYATFANGQYYFGNDVYARQMRALRAQFAPGQRVEFLLCSDEALNPADFAGLPVHRGSGHFVEDLYALAGCDYLLGPPSSYSMWASFYGEVPLCHLHEASQPVQLADFAVFLDQ
ncbi:hypothetical protein MUN81_15690 [Hymenobacter sp. 5317J-9]|uniref:hypothetical protein n=1 Tax=Hymenobacter sp. 5317J-9 TaxID=2932250 RepID=UPI001FD64DC6|nr:hypothetical protein [Hymenobacter sp. 5317J-9]UOQ96678.1 hypothetical protein MUN81_15690 [Hymenobacter sp. 5317J-9]